MMRISIFIALLASAFAFTACEEELDLQPENSLTLNNALVTPQDFESALNGVEQILKNIYCMSTGISQMVKGAYVDYVADNTSQALKNQYTSQEIRSMNTAQWVQEYQGITSANTVLNRVDDAPLSEERRRQYKGQALFFKAMFYFRIIQYWGDCILSKNDVVLTPTAKTPWDEVATYAIELAREAVDLLPEFSKMTNWKGETYPNKAFPGKEAANALLAHICAWKAGCKYFAANQDYDEISLWEEAEQACTGIIESEDFYLEPDPEAVCTRGLVANSPESIYETVNRGYEYELAWSADYPMLTCCLADKSLMMVGYPVNPSVSVESMEYANYRILVSTVDRWYQNGDKRKNAFFYQPDELAEQTGGYAWLYKYRELLFDKNYGYSQGVDQNLVHWRLAEIYLLRAECRVRLGDNAGAIEDLNKVRERAGAELYDASEDGDDLRYTIFLERQKELCYEGYRYFDVIRNGYVNTELLGDFRTLTVQDMKDGALFMCIAETAFTNNPLMRQNTYWFRRM